jgi:hypothetical protein
MIWLYGGEAEDTTAQIPDPAVLTVESQWDSFEVLHFPEVVDEGKGWDPEGRTLGVYGVFAESNVWLYAYIWRIGTGAEAPPDPEPYADLLAGVADQVRGQLEVNAQYEGD